MASCKTCSHYKQVQAPDKTLIFECWRNPPSVHVMWIPRGKDAMGNDAMAQLTVTTFPQPKPDWHCGEWTNGPALPIWRT